MTAIAVSGCGGKGRTDQTAPQGQGGGTAGSAGSATATGGSGGTWSSSGGVAGSSGGALGGTTGNAGTAGSAGTVGGSAGAPTVTLHECPPEPELPCTPNVFDGMFQSGGLTPISALEGVTEITGSLLIYQAAGLDVLHCLERVGGQLSVSGGGLEPGTLWGLRNVRWVNSSIDISASLNELYIDCGLSRLESIRDPQATMAGSISIRSEGVRGELDLSRAVDVRSISFWLSSLERVTLPSNAALEMTSLGFERNALLTEIQGFENVTLQMPGGQPIGLESIEFIDNPLLPTCRAQALSDLFVQAGWDPATVTISGNSADCPP